MANGSCFVIDLNAASAVREWRWLLVLQAFQENGGEPDGINADKRRESAVCVG